MTGSAAADPYRARPWTAAYPPSVPAIPTVPRLSLGALLDEVAARFGAQPALICRHTRLTYAELSARVNRMAATLHRLGVHPGDRVAIVHPNTPEFVVAFLAVARLGALAVPLNPLAPADQLEAPLIDSGARIVVCIDTAAAAVHQVRDRTSVREVLVSTLGEADGTATGWRSVLSAARARRSAHAAGGAKGAGVTRLAAALRNPGRGVPRISVDPDTPVLLAYTSGTTGAPRPTVLTHHNVIANGYQLGWLLPDVRPGREVVLSVLPLFHPYGLVLGLLPGVLLGGTTVLVHGLDQRELLAAFDRHAPTLFSAVPAVFRALLDSDDLRPQHGAGVRTAISVGASLPSAVADEFERRTSSVLLEGYGLAEAPLTHAVLHGRGRADGLIGVPLPLTDVRIVAPDNPTAVLPVGRVGELAVRGPQVSTGSWGGAGTPSAAGYIVTGDLAVMEPDGNFTLVARVADALRIGDQLVGPERVESVIVALPQVARAGVVQVAGVLVAYVEAVEAAEPISAGDVRDACTCALPSQLVPAHVELLPALPRTGIGTVLRSALRDQAAAAGYRLADVPAPVSRERTASGAAKKTAAKKTPAKKTAAAKKAAGATAQAPRKKAASRTSENGREPSRHRAAATPPEEDGS